MAVANTNLLRGSDDPFWTRLRELLRARRIDSASSAIATCFPDGGDLEFGIVVTSDGEVFEFDFVYGSRGDIKARTNAAVFADWRRTTELWPDRPWREEVRAAFGILGIPA